MIKLRNKKHAFSTFVDSAIPFANQSIREVISPYMTEGEFQVPTIVRVNDVPKLRKDWDLPLQDEDVVDVIPVVGELVTAMIVINLIVLVASAAFAVYGTYKARQAMRAMRAGQGQAEADPFFSIDGQGNKANLNNPVEVAYGRNRMWPSYIGRPYRTYRDDRLHGWDDKGFTKNINLVQIFCLGQGDFEVHAVQAGDTPVESYRGLTYEIIPPGGSSTGLAHIVYIQPDFEEISLAVNQSTDSFLMTPAGVVSNRFEIDVEFPTNGEFLIQANFTEVTTGDGAVLVTTPITVDLNRPYHTYMNGTTDKTEANPAPHRHTFQFVAGDASKRYSLRIYNTSGSQTLKILQLRSFSDPQMPLGYSDKTLLVLNYFVTNSNEGAAKDKINVIATRKLKTISTVGGSRVEILQPTRSIVWAFYDSLVNNVYGGGLQDDFIDVETLQTIDQTLAKDGLTFDNVFNQTSSVEDACKVIGAAGRCSMAYNGSKLTLVQDAYKGPAEAMFSTENIVEGSFQWSSEMFDPTEPDSVEVGFVETDAGQQNTVLFIPEGSLGNNVQKLTLTGVSRKTAWREAAYKMRRLQLVRDTFKFKTGMEGYIPTVGSVAMLSWDLTAMGESGYVEGYNAGWLHLSRSISVATGSVRARIALRRDDGSVMGPFDIASVANVDSSGRCKTVNIGNIDFGIDFWRTDREPVHFVAWAGSGDIPVNTKIQIESAVPTDDGFVDITATNYDSKVYEFDNVEPPADEYLPVTPTGVVPSIPWLKVEPVNTPANYTRISWGSAFGATSYKVYIADILHWTGTETYLETQLVADPDSVIEVSAINISVEGPRVRQIVSIGQAVSTTSVFFASSEIYRLEEDGFVVFWDNVLNVDYFKVRVVVDFTNGTVRNSPWYDTKSTSFKYTKANFANDIGLVAVSANSIVVAIQVRAVVNGATTSVTETTFTIPRAVRPDAISIQQDPQIVYNTTRFTRHRTVKWANPPTQVPGTTYRLYLEAYISGYDPTAITPKAFTKVLTTDKCLLSTSQSVGRIEVENAVITPLNPSYGGAPLDANANHPVYGPGCMASIYDAGQTFIMDPGETQEHTLFVYNPSDPESGSWHTMIKFGTSQVDGIVWISKATSAYLTGKRAAVVYPHNTLNSASGNNVRVKGAVIADNGWFDSSAISVATFDIDA